MKFLVIIVLLSISLSNVNAACEERCTDGQTVDHICTGARTFLLCNDKRASGDKKSFECPPQYNCVASKNLCELNATPACSSGCSICNPVTGIACISKRIYAFCFGGTVPHMESTGTCERESDFCNANEKSFCSNKASCESETIVSPTGSTPTGSSPADITIFCRKINQGGKFTPAGDKTCMKYNYCYMSRGQVMGKQYNCPGDTLFDCETQQCSKKCNSNCRYPGLNPLPQF